MPFKYLMVFLSHVWYLPVQVKGLKSLSVWASLFLSLVVGSLVMMLYVLESASKDRALPV